jgi:hypothetical protein
LPHDEHFIVCSSYISLSHLQQIIKTITIL